MKYKVFSIMCAALMVAGCSNSDDDNRAMEYDTLNVGFKGNKTSGTWLQGDEVGIFAFCTRNDEQDTPMSANANARYTVAAESESAMLAAATDGDAAIAISNDHNYRFYAYYPYSDKVTDLKAIGVSAPAEQPYTGEANGSFYVAQKTVTTIVPTVELEFKNIFATLVLNLPNNLLSEDGNSTVKKLTLKPATAENFNEALAVSGTYNLTTGTLTKTSADAKQITIDFGEQGLPVNYTKVPIVINPCTIPEGGFEVVFTDMNGKESSQIILAGDAGKAIAAGEVSEQNIRGFFDDGIVPVTFPVIFLTGYDGDEGLFSPANQPRWETEGYWSCPSQPQAYAQGNFIEENSYLDYPREFKRVASKQNGIYSPSMKGIWTGDNIEFTLPVKKFAAGTKVEITFPLYARYGTIFWNIEYLDGEEWKCNKSEQTVNGDEGQTYKRECTFLLGNAQTTVVKHEMTFEKEVKSGELKIRLTCADATVQWKEEKGQTAIEVDKPQFSGQGNSYSPFYFKPEGDLKDVIFSIVE